MKKILIIPDVHGREFWIEPCSHADEFDKIIFLGDYHDPYPFQVSQEISRHRLCNELIPFVEANRDKVICLYGNHDCYLIGDTTCRYDKFHKQEIKEYLQKLNLQISYQIDNYLFTHSGVLPKWLNNNELTLEDLKTMSLDNDSLYNISWYRGGYHNCGSCIWGDVREYDEEEHIPGLYQIFGHTQLQEGPIIKDDYACLDCRKAFVLNTETKEIIEWIG